VFKSHGDSHEFFNPSAPQSKVMKHIWKPLCAPSNIFSIILGSKEEFIASVIAVANASQQPQLVDSTWLGILHNPTDCINIVKSQNSPANLKYRGLGSPKMLSNISPRKVQNDPNDGWFLILKLRVGRLVPHV
jgi:hypothetical protein